MRVQKTKFFILSNHNDSSQVVNLQLPIDVLDVYLLGLSFCPHFSSFPSSQRFNIIPLFVQSFALVATAFIPHSLYGFLFLFIKYKRYSGGYLCPALFRTCVCV